MDFDTAHAEFVKHHQSQRRGERLRRLEEGHGHAETLFLQQVWWLAFGHFNHLHPEYEVFDFKDGHRYLDFAFIRPHFRVAIEIDGYGPHWKNLNRWQFSDQLQRQNHLVIDGWKVLRFTYDDVKEKPRFCQQTLQQLMGRWLGDETNMGETTCYEKEILRLALRKGSPITPSDVCAHLQLEVRVARKYLQMLVDKKWFQPASGEKRIRSYRLDNERRDFIF